MVKKPTVSLAHSNDAPIADPGPDAPVRMQLRMKDFIDRVTERSGVRKSDARAAAEAALAVLAEALENGEDPNLPPLGKLKLTREKDNPRAKVMTLRLIRQKGTDAGSDPLADRAD